MRKAYAEKTEVPASRTRQQIEALVLAHGGSDYTLSLGERAARIGFRLGGRAICLALPLPDPADRQFSHWKSQSGWESPRTASAARDHWERACRARWRALLLVIQAKLEAIRIGITTVDEAFFADVMVDGGSTVYERHARNVLPAFPTAQAPRALR
jgi:hypothetical protein